MKARSACVFGLVLVAACVFSAEGLVGFSSLKIMPGAREAGMGGIGVVSGIGPQSVVWNPAAIALTGGFAATASYAKWFLDTHQQSVFVCRDLRVLAVGLGGVSFSGGQFEHREGPNEQPIGYFVPTELSLYVSMARRIGSSVQFGLTGRYFYSRISGDDAEALGVDAGLRVRPTEGLTLGASVVDFGRKLRYQYEAFRLPTRARLGASHDFTVLRDGKATVALDASYFFNTREFEIAPGVELEWRRLAALRAGYAFFSENHLTFGLGLKAGVLRVDYAFLPFGSNLGSAHRVAVGLGW